MTLKGFNLMAMIVTIMAKNHFFTIEGDDKYLYQHTGGDIKRWTRKTLCEHLQNQNVDEDIIDIISRDDNIVYIADCLPKAGGKKEISWTVTNGPFNY